MATLGTLFGGVWLATRGGGEKKTAQGPPVQASSKDEEQFIQYVALELLFCFNVLHRLTTATSTGNSCRKLVVARLNISLSVES